MNALVVQRIASELVNKKVDTAFDVNLKAAPDIVSRQSNFSATFTGGKVHKQWPVIDGADCCRNVQNKVGVSRQISIQNRNAPRLIRHNQFRVSLNGGCFAQSQGGIKV